MRRTCYALILFALVSLGFLIVECKGQNQGFRIVADPYQYEGDTFKPWNNDMIRIGITTRERGLIFKITILNLQSRAFELADLRITVSVKYGSEIYYDFFKQVSISYIYLSRNGSYEVIIPVTFLHIDVGSYTAQLFYTLGNGGSQPFEPSPFQFRIKDEIEFQKEIEQKRGGTTIIQIQLVSIGLGIDIVGISWITVELRRRRKTNSTKKQRKIRKK